MRRHHRTRSTVLVAIVALAAFGSCSAAEEGRASAATVTASYEQGRADVVVNGYGTRAMGTFRLRDGATTHLALCIEADVAHSGATDAYAPVDPRVRSAQLDALLWWLDRQPTIDDDTAVAASALAWFYADARRSFGPPVWSDGTRDFAPITPVAPEPWDALAPFSMSHPVGLVVPGLHLDAAERRVADLHRIASHLSGTWELEVVARSGAVTGRLTADGAALPGRPIDVEIDPAAGAVVTRTVTTDEHGRFSVTIPPAPDGYVTEVTTAAPGPHREWDGPGSIQRLATPTSTVVSAMASRGPDDGHLVVRKVSTDPTIGVEGAVFDLIDARGALVATARTDHDGLVRFTDIDRAAHPGPYSVVETAAPAGLRASPEPIVVDRLGVDPDDPPTIDVVNQTATASLLIRKTLSIDAAGPDDRSGFGFSVRRRTDGAEHRLVSGEDGVAGPIALPLGTYDVCESAVPDWASSLIDTGCHVVDVSLGSLGTTVELVYVNEVPVPGIDTWATDPADDDQVLELHQTEVVDRVDLSGLVPGTTYRVRGGLVDATNGTPTEAVGWTEFTADGPTARVDVTIRIDEPMVGSLVVVDEVYVGDTLLVRHADLQDADQTITVLPPPTTTTSTTSTTSTTTVVPASTAPSTVVPASTAPSTTTTSTTTSATTSTTSTTTVAPLRHPPSTLPPTGADAVATALRLGDAGFVVGIGLFAIAGLVPARRGSGRDEAGR